MNITRVVDGKIINIELTESEQISVFKEEERKIKIKKSLLMLKALKNFETDEANLSDEQKELLVRMADDYQDNFFDYGPGYSWQSTYNTFYHQLVVLFPSLKTNA